ncbi:unnamed protein product [marine sediment metagenome]|uniref:Uncharacterized protein n=1 Tax=marine sediment metagenome TaxID=412755 RepID=X1LYY6_9ZZZZ
MPMKVKSEQINTEHYHYTLDENENQLFPVKARPGEVIIVHSVCIYNDSGANYDVCYKLMKQRGHVIRLNYVATINAGVVQRWATDVYLNGEEECGVAVTPNAAGDTLAVNFQILRFRDDEYTIPT